MPLLTRNPLTPKAPGRAHPYVHPYNGPPSGNRPASSRDLAEPRSGFFETCSNPRCGSGRLKLWPGRKPLFEGGWCCSPECTRAQIDAALSRELGMRGAAPESHRHRIPLGLAMLDHGWITTRQLREALEAQKATGGGRLGEWLVSQKAVSEDLVTRALGLQWSCPVLGIDCHDAEAMTALLPRIFVETFRALPLRVAAGRILYLGFESRPDPVLALAIERMTGLRVETGLVQGSSFRPAHARMLAAHHQPEGIAESVSDISLAGSLLHALECARPADARLVRVHDCLWLRMWMRPAKGYASDPGSIEDLICPTPGRYDAQADPTSAEHP